MASVTQKTPSQILQKFLGSGINISPSALTKIQSLPLSWKDIETFIQKISFSPDFSSYLSETQVSNEFNPIIKTEPNTDLPSPENEDPSALKNKQSSQMNSELVDVLKQQGYGQPDNVCELEPIPEKPSLSSEEDAEVKKITQSPTKNSPIERSQSFKSSSISKKDIQINTDQSILIQENTNVNSPFESSTDTSIPSSESPTLPSSDDEDEIRELRNQKRKSWEKLILKSGTSTFTPKASEYDGQINILKDPTGHLFTEGKLEEFIAVMKDKYEKIRAILKKRPEGNEILDIGMINRLENSVEVKFIGMVVEKRQTSNKNYIITFEDPTGTCTALVRQEPVELFQLVTHLLPDQVVIIDGYLSVKHQTNSRIVLVNKIIFPDAPNRSSFPGSPDDLSICFISDTHFGSKDWLGNVWHRFVDFLNCKIGNDKQREQAGKIKYLCIAGDIVDGIGIFPNQDKRLAITDIYKQYDVTAEFFAEIPDYIEIIVSPGDHDAVRNAIPRPALDKDIAKNLYDDPQITMVGCPALVELHGVKTQIFHGTSLIDLNMSIPGMTNEDPVKTMQEFILSRHLAPSYGKKTRIAPVEKDWLVLDTLPDILHTGHLHKNGAGWYHGTLLVNSGCFQGQTSFMDNLGIEPDYGKPTIVNIKDRLDPHVIDLVGN